MQNLTTFAQRLCKLNGIIYSTLWNRYTHKHLFPNSYISSKHEGKIEWIRPRRLPSYNPKNSGDLAPIRFPDDDELLRPFSDLELLNNNKNEELRKIFSMKNQTPIRRYEAYKSRLVESVQSHKFDNSTLEVRIAELTARIRKLQNMLEISPKHKCRALLTELIAKRRKKLKNLRELDYKKFEWILETLNLVHKADPIVREVVRRKKSIRLLAELKARRLQEEKLAEYKKELDQQKIPFLEKKIKEIKWIMDQEKEFQLQPTVSISDIENCREQIENVKCEILERQKRGYQRRIHPYTLEVYEAEAPLPTKNDS